MFERFTDTARHVVAQAQEAARGLGHGYIGCEHLLLAAAAAASIYDIPKVLHAEGLDAYVVRRLSLPFRDVDWAEWDELLRTRAPAESARDDRVGQQIRRPARCLPVGDRGAAGGGRRQRHPASTSGG